MNGSENIMIWIGIALACLLVLLLCAYSIPKLAHRKRDRKALLISKYPTACAGSSEYGVPDAVESVSVHHNTFLGKQGEVLDPDEYYQFVVEGNSMRFCNIFDKDLIFVAKGFRIVQLKKFPYILVIKKHRAIVGESSYKVRRAWSVVRYDSDRFMADLKSIMRSDAFQEIKQLADDNGKSVYPGDSEIARDFKEKRLPRYEKDYIDVQDPDEWNKSVVISTTFDTKERYIHFSIHPIAQIVGIVKGSFSVQNSIPKL